LLRSSFGEGAGATEVAGVLLVAVGVVLVRGLGTRGDARTLLLVTTIAASIAAYTLVDRAGIQHAGALTYFVLVLAGPCLVYPPIVGWRSFRRALGATAAAAAVANVSSFHAGTSRLADRRSGSRARGALVVDRDRDCARGSAPCRDRRDTAVSRLGARPPGIVVLSL
jgi:drug/metabolite transporter (DMT)-like permease